ncbi:MAG: serine/threonine protein kinase [Gemmataceae bacterium]|nr:serine/threonine protein kinase [Gemmataceae bacterium]
MQERPSREQLRAYALGLLSEREQWAVADYLDQNPEAVADLSAVDNEPDLLVAALRRPAADYTVEPAFWRGLSQARGLQPPANPDDGNRGEAVPAVPLAEPTRLGHYRLERRVSQRAESRVYRAVDECAGTPVAVKLLLPQHDQGHVAARFRREATLVANLHHPHIVAHRDFGEAAGTLFLATEWLDGCDLSALVEKVGVLPVAAACAVVQQAAVGLQHAHEHGLVHRDVKPSNLFLTRDGRVKVLDLGLARCLVPGTDEESLTHSGQLLGTLDYMSPEQAMDPQAVDARADIYGLGCTLYKLLVGHAPFGGPNSRYPLRVLLAHCSLPVPPVRDRRPEVPEGLEAVVLRLLAKNPNDRFQTMGEVSEALAPFAAGADLPPLAALVASESDDATTEPGSPVGVPASPMRRTHPRRAGSRRMLLCVATVVAAGLAVWVGAIFHQPTAQTGTHPPEKAPMPPLPPAVVAERGFVLAPVPGTGRWDLVPNGDFEEDVPGHPAGWPPQVPDDNRGLGVFRRSAAQAFQGRASAQAVPAKDIANTGFAHITDYLRVVPYRRYVLSAFFHTEALTSGELSLDLASVSFDVRVVAPPRVKGWQFRWCSFTPTQDRIRIRLVRDGKVRAGESGFIDGVAVTLADDFLPPESTGN